MSILKTYIASHPDLFGFLASDEVHPHDRLMAKIALRFIPNSVTPNQITSFRVIATPFVFFLILGGFYRAGIAAFLLVAFTDVIDGSLARTRDKITNFGKMYDPLADKLLIGSMVLLLVFEFFSFWLGITILFIEIIFIMSAFVVKYKFKTVPAANRWGKVKMLLQVIAVFLTLLGMVFNAPEFFTAAAWLFGLAIGFAVASLFAHGI